MSLASFARPRALDEALALLAGGGWAILAGGTDFYPSRVGRPVSEPVLDITAVEGLRAIRNEGAHWTFGATATWSDVLRAGLPRQFDALAQVAREVGGAQIQNTGTLAGNLCNASPAADGAPVWMALDATVVLQSTRGRRDVAVTDFLLGSRKTARAPDELLTAIRVPSARGDARSVFLKLGSRRYLVISIAMVSVALETDATGIVTRAGVAVGACSAVAQRLRPLEGRLAGQRAGAGLARLVVPGDLDALTPIDDVRGSAGYRLDATLTLLRRALTEAGNPRPGESA